MLDLTVLILTYNERENLARTLQAVAWAPRVLLIDSFSTDETLEIARMFPNVAVAERAFDSFARQCNFGLTQITTPWVLSIDADYVLTPELVKELRELEPPPEVAGFATEFYYNVHGRRLRSTLYPPRTVLYQRLLATYADEGHGHRVSVSGRIVPLAARIDHDDRKPLSRWMQSQDSYTKIEARHLWATSDAELSAQDRLRKRIFFAAPVMFLYLLVGRGLLLDGWPGWYYVAQRTIAELLLSLRLLGERERLER